MIKFNSGLFKLYDVHEKPDAPPGVEVAHRKTWNLPEQIQIKYGNNCKCEMGNLSRMNYKSTGMGAIGNSV